ncbi:hypothetical protein PILCRDRAFT_517017 [Piloderma croceum F 1598]|uniref:Uncharacterized protein n=1 Tax=Piloderma croceum (strain F 1598) TaxID=765440 RepID=A0A0C3F7Z5_PILCF|nr:hypothetical protein PILCRDRAFT_517017 [Piloderma croceum F 1598]
MGRCLVRVRVNCLEYTHSEVLYTHDASLDASILNPLQLPALRTIRFSQCSLSSLCPRLVESDSRRAAHSSCIQVRWIVCVMLRNCASPPICRHGLRNNDNDICS